MQGDKKKKKKKLWLPILKANKNIYMSVVLCVFMGFKDSRAALFLQLAYG